MCVRYSQSHEPGALAARFGVQPPAAVVRPGYSIAPGRECAVITGAEVKLLKWGFIPGWSGGEIKEGLANARAEGIASRPTFRAAFYKSRCLVPADGFYEWAHTAGDRIPYRFEFRDRSLFAMAGIYDAETRTFAVVTCAANALVRTIHHRMPVILDRDKEKLWMDMRSTNTEELLPILRAFDSSLMRGYKVSSLVDSPDNDSPGCMEPMQP